MTKKDYEALARILATFGERIPKRRLVTYLCIAFKHENPRFDEDKFHSVCYPKGGGNVS